MGVNEKEGREVTGQVFEMGDGSEEIYARIYGKEVQREKVRRRAGMRTWNYEKKLEDWKEGELARECWKKLRNRMKREKIIGRGGGEKKIEFMEKRG